MGYYFHAKTAPKSLEWEKKRSIPDIDTNKKNRVGKKTLNPGIYIQTTKNNVYEIQNPQLS